MATLKTDDAILKLIEEKLIRVYQDGLIYSTVTNRYLTTGTPENNKSVTFRYQGETYASSKARVLWLAFKGRVPEGLIVAVKEVGQPITVDNIEAMTFSQANARKVFEEKKIKGESCHFSRFTNDEVLALRREYTAKPFVLRTKAAELKTDHNTLGNLLSGKSYKTVPEPCVLVKVNRFPAKGTPEDIARVKERRRLNAEKNRRSKQDQKPVVKKPLYDQTVTGRTTPQVYHDRKRLEREATELLKQSRPVKPKPEPKPKIVKEKATKPIVETLVVEKSVGTPIDYGAAREKLRLQKEANRERIEQDRVDRQLQEALQDKEKLKRIDMIRRIAEKRQGQASSNLTPFKQFAVYHLHAKLGETLESIAKVIRVEDQTLVELALKAFKPEAYETTRNELIEKHGRDSVILNSIRLFEGDFNHEE